ncbi:copper homeostasis protein CutC [Pseudochrobactrum kiredjianiae]|uniref:PF03932 family protein CutC n=1 Tax=Pseudochrobactrum kiredjianiae TaxID=386305 RepID=A0ABW3V6I1_9HYPH|nr:copper homeostasis protein CutC [Pseudochrobactrum kiredjianiae]MDM7853043.1 copper homeostasis protein CutC [Pseudochrobactrum kiredjianiae]
MKKMLEICVDDPEGLAAALEGGADRIELCSSLDSGGLTPTAGLIAQAALAPVPIYAMIRPRAGNFCFTPLETDAMLHEIETMRKAGLAGVVLGASMPDGSLDTVLLRRFVQQAEGMGLTLHRAFDLVPDPFEALEQAIDLGFERILTSGQQLKAIDGTDLLQQLVQHAGNRISIMPGSGVKAENAQKILQATGVHEIHSSGRVSQPNPDVKSVEFGFALPLSSQTSAENIRKIKNIAAQDLT